MSDYPIILKNINKTFRIGSTAKDSVLNRCLSFLSGREKKLTFSVLSNICLKAEKGTVTGIIGRNGSGKSTLLRLIAGIYQPDNGEMTLEGKMVYMTGFGQGLMPKLTTKENIYLIGSLLDLSRRDIERKIDEILDFSELGRYINTKVYQFSSGMLGRLSFSTTILCVNHKKPDIILIDEALDAGADINFQHKAMAKIEEMIGGGATVILISHNLETIGKFCEQVIWLDQGKIIKEGPAKEIIEEYVKING